MADSKLENPLAALEQRIESLESQHVFQDDIIEQLSQELAVHQSQIAGLKYQIQLLVNRIKDNNTSLELAGGAETEVEPPPPHY